MHPQASYVKRSAIILKGDVIPVPAGFWRKQEDSNHMQFYENGDVISYIAGGNEISA
jgi:hypothetical protein